jgi:signal peptidase I
MRPGPLRSLLLALPAAAAAVAALRRLDLVEVRGRSMLPTLLPGDRLLLVRGRPRPGDVVVTADPRDARRELVKRVAALGPGGATLRGDNPAASTDARTFGAVPAERVSWRAVARAWPPRRIGRIPPAPPALERLDEGGELACAFPEALIAGDAGASVSPG